MEQTVKRKTDNDVALISMLLMLVAVVCAQFVTRTPAVAGVNTAQKLVSKRQPIVPAEGTLLGSPKAGMDPEVALLVEPGLMSIVFTSEETAWDFYHEAVANGENVCISDLGPRANRPHGQRFWLRSC